MIIPDCDQPFSDNFPYSSLQTPQRPNLSSSNSRQQAPNTAPSNRSTAGNMSSGNGDWSAKMNGNNQQGNGQQQRQQNNSG
jgi:hypothetical protein